MTTTFEEQPLALPWSAKYYKSFRISAVASLYFSLCLKSAFSAHRYMPLLPNGPISRMFSVSSQADGYQKTATIWSPEFYQESLAISEPNGMSRAFQNMRRPPGVNALWNPRALFFQYSKTLINVQ